MSNTLVDRRRMMSREVDYLPIEYQQVEYLRGTGQQYINLNIPHDGTIPNNFDVDIEIDVTAENNGENIVFGRYTGTFIDMLRNNLQYGLFIPGTGRTIRNALVVNKRCVVKLECRYINNTRLQWNAYINGVLIDNFVYIGTIGEWTSYAFGGNYRGIAKIHSLFIKKAGKIYNWVPCYRKADSVAGLYDIHNHVFKVNNGTGTFGVGNPI